MSQQSRVLNDEAKHHIRLLSGIEKEMDTTSEALKDESMHVERTKTKASGVCWMYGVIVLEIFCLLILLTFGLS